MKYRAEGLLLSLLDCLSHILGFFACVQVEDASGAIARFLMTLEIVTCLWCTGLCYGPLWRDFPFSYVFMLGTEVLMSALLVVG